MYLWHRGSKKKAEVFQEKSWALCNTQRYKLFDYGSPLYLYQAVYDCNMCIFWLSKNPLIISIFLAYIESVLSAARLGQTRTSLSRNSVRSTESSLAWLNIIRRSFLISICSCRRDCHAQYESTAVESMPGHRRAGPCVQKLLLKSKIWLISIGARARLTFRVLSSFLLSAWILFSNAEASLARNCFSFLTVAKSKKPY